MLYIVVIGLAIFCGVLLVLVVLAQNSKGGGLSSQFGGSGASNLIGVKKTGDLLERLTWGFAIAIIVLALSSTKITPTQANTDTFERFKDQTPAAQPLLPKAKTGAKKDSAATKK